MAPQGNGLKNKLEMLKLENGIHSVCYKAGIFDTKEGTCGFIVAYYVTYISEHRVN
jgi:hypothetical protein